MRARFLGRSAREANLEIESELGRALPEEFDALLKAALFREFAATLEATPHMHATLAAIAQPVCVASSGTPEKIRNSLTRTGLHDRFAPHIFSATQVRNGKPAPDLFLYAASQMGAAPSRCLVIEDSVPGIRAAGAAGMAAVGFHGGSHCRHGDAEALRGAGALATFGDMRELPAMMTQAADIAENIASA